MTDPSRDDLIYDLLATVNPDFAVDALEYAKDRKESLYEFVTGCVAGQVGWTKEDGAWQKN